jgi:hypothetical protein
MGFAMCVLAHYTSIIEKYEFLVSRYDQYIRVQM